MGKYIYAFGFGWVLYMIGIGSLAQEGFKSLTIQPFLAAITSLGFTLLAALVGQIFRIQKLYNSWNNVFILRYILWLIGLLLLVYPIPLGYHTNMVNHRTGEIALNFPYIPLLFGYFLIIFVVTSWPISKSSIDKNDKD